MSDVKSEQRMNISSSSRHGIVYYDASKWAAVPANNGGNGPVWQWGDELLLGFTMGRGLKRESSHQCDYDYPFESWLARSTNGGETWSAWKPENYVGSSREPQPPPGGLDFSRDGFVMRVVDNGYHANEGCHWFYSEDRGENWKGPFDFGDIMSHPELEEKEFTGRTGYIIDGPGKMYLFFSVRQKAEPDEPDYKIWKKTKEKTFLVSTEDGGGTFTFVSWVVPWDEPHRAVMAAPARLSPTELVTALRRRSQKDDRVENWIGLFASTDNGGSWSHRSVVGYTETGPVQRGGNPPALIQMSDRRLCCAYGNRTDRVMTARFSGDGGRTWGDEHMLRDGFQSMNGFADLGYPRLFQRTDGKLVTAYFWCTPDKPQTHIEMTIFEG